MNQLLADVSKNPQPVAKKRKVEANMGGDPFQTIASRLFAIRKYILEHNKKPGNIEIEARLGLILSSETHGRTGPFTPGAGAVEILAADMQKRRFVSGVTKKDFHAYSKMQESTCGAREKSNRKAYTYSDGRRLQVDEQGNRVLESKTRELESQFHLPSCPYDCRITVSMERELSPEQAAGSVTDDWESCRVKHRTSFLKNHLPNRTKSVWQADMTHVEALERKDGAQHTESVFEVELELSGKAVEAWFNAEDVQKETGNIAWDLWERISLMMPREETCSTLNEDKDGNLLNLAAVAVQRPFGQTTSEGSSSFPGTLPVGFGRRMIEKVQKDGQYMVSEKTDGVRHFLVVVDAGTGPQAILLDRKMRVFTMPGMEDLGKAFGVGTVIDGEVVRNRSWKRDIFMCFDVLSNHTVSVTSKVFKQRLAVLTEMLSKKYLALLAEQRESVCATMKTLPIVLKHFYPAQMVAEVIRHIHFEGTDRVYLERGGDGQPAKALKRHHKSDGLIFAPNTSYCRGTDFNYLKWKWHDMITLDFEIRWGGGSEHGLNVSFAGQGNELIDFTEHVILPSHDLHRLIGDLAGKNVLIGEFEFSPDEGAWLYKLPRPDKKRANYSRTILSTLMELAEGMEIEELTYKLSFKGHETDDWDAAMKVKRQELLASRKGCGGKGH